MTLSEVAAKAKLVPLLSGSALRLLEIVRDDRHRLSDVIPIVASDPALTARLLMAANAPAYSQRGQVVSLDRAVAVLGEKMVSGIALALCAPFIYQSELTGYAGARGDLWKHCLCAAIAARQVSRYASRDVVPDVAYTAGLLHDIGKGVISEGLAGKTAELLAGVDEHKARDFLESERQILGYDHAELGEAVARHWRLPEPYPTVIRFHHQPSQAPDQFRHEAFAAHLGDLVAMMAGAGTGADAMQYALDPEYEKYYHLPEAGLELVLLDVAEEYEQTKELFFPTQA